MTEDRISDLEAQSIEVTQSEQHRGKKKKIRASWTCGIETNILLKSYKETEVERDNDSRSLNLVKDINLLSKSQTINPMNSTSIKLLKTKDKKNSSNQPERNDRLLVEAHQFP